MLRRGPKMNGVNMCEVSPTWKRYYFECMCYDQDHTLIVDDVREDDWTEFNVSVMIKPEPSLFWRIWLAIKYIFNKTQNTYYFNCVSLQRKDVESLMGLCREHLQHKND